MGMDRDTKRGIICACVTLFLVIVFPIILLYIFFFPHTQYFFIDRAAVCREYGIDPEGDFSIVKFYDGSFLITIDTELTIDVEDAESFMRDCLERSPVTKRSEGVYRYGEHHPIEIYVTPRGEKYRLRLVHTE